MPKKIANKDLPAADAVPGGTKLLEKIARRRAALEKVRETGADAAAVRAARKALKRGQRRLRKTRIRAALATKAGPAAAPSA